MDGSKFYVAKLDLIFIFILSIFVFLASCFYLPLFVSGDQANYYCFYTGSSGLGVSDSYRVYRECTGASEPFYFVLVYVASALGFDKSVVFSFFNAFLFFSFASFFRGRGVAFLVIVMVGFFSYYFLAMYTELERLKVSFAFFFLSFFFFSIGRKYSFCFFSFLAVLSHFQIVLFYFAVFSMYFMRPFKVLFVSGRLSYYYILGLFLFLSFFVLFFDNVYSKYSFYVSKGYSLDWFSVLKVFPLFAFSLYYFGLKRSVFYTWFSVFVFILVFGGFRMNLVAYFVFLLFCMHYRRGFNFAVISSAIYFAYTGISSFNNVWELGRFYPY